ncbi:hypothetical protein CLOM_g23941, partial [Closterium sp. NIES-68]
LEFLGHLIGNNGHKVDPKKVVAVQIWPVLQDVGQVRSFLGLANYFRQFLENYLTDVAPVTALTRKGCAWEWTRQCQEAFEEVKTKLNKAPVLVLPNPSKPYEMVTDTSTVGIGVVLLQEGRPVAFQSRKLSPAEQRYTASEQELLVVVHAMQTWRCYLEGVEFVVTTDHCPNTDFSTQATLTRRQARWEELLSAFTFDIRYRAGSTNMADPHIRRTPGHQENPWALSDVYWWLGLGTEVQQFVSPCDACARNKSDNKSPGGLLQPLGIPDKPWEIFSLDFYHKPPQDTRWSYCDPSLCGSIDQNGALRCYYNRHITAKLFVAHVFRLHRLPRVLVSYRDPCFTSRFWQKVTRTLGTKLKMASAFHPQTDGQTERTNGTLEQMLRSFIGPTQDDLEELLPMVEFAVNNSVHEGTHEKPFILNCGQHPTTPAMHGIGKLRRVGMVACK